MKKILILLEILISIIFIIVIYGFFTIFIQKQEITGKKSLVNKGQTINSIYKDLEISYNIFDKIFFRYTNEAKNIKSGEYEFSENLSKYNIIKRLQDPKYTKIVLTIPEGFTSEQVLDRIEAIGLASKKDMIDEMENYKFDYIHNSVFEGYFYPETYYFSREDSPKKILDKIFSEFKLRYPINKYDKKEFYEILILASIVEKEAKLDEDRDKVAAVFKNRLKIDMPLQSDATLKYELKRNVYKKDLLTSMSKYNTYKHKGLTPSPISNPSAKSIKAAMNPAKINDLYFFMHNEKTYYSKTHSEHLRKRKESGQIK